MLGSEKGAVKRAEASANGCEPPPLGQLPEAAKYGVSARFFSDNLLASGGLFP